VWRWGAEARTERREVSRCCAQREGRREGGGAGTRVVERAQWAEGARGASVRSSEEAKGAGRQILEWG